MKFFIDFEFVEGFHKPLFGRRRHFIDLLSIGMVCEDGRTYYAVNKDYDRKKVRKNKFVRYNVIPNLYEQFWSGERCLHGGNKIVSKAKQYMCTKSMDQINKDILDFVYGSYPCLTSADIAPNYDWLQYIHEPSSWYPVIKSVVQSDPIEFYGYFCDYDWVLFCSIFGDMMSLPLGFPMYCRDLKQTLDEYVDDLISSGNAHMKSEPFYRDHEHNNLTEKQQTLLWVKSLPDYPKDDDRHNSYYDAKWNHDLYNFLQKNR